jgi:tetrahydromethanopterin S-methyltransferase subunit D
MGTPLAASPTAMHTGTYVGTWPSSLHQGTTNLCSKVFSSTYLNKFVLVNILKGAINGVQLVNGNFMYLASTSKVTLEQKGR